SALPPSAAAMLRALSTALFRMTATGEVDTELASISRPSEPYPTMLFCRRCAARSQCDTFTPSTGDAINSVDERKARIRTARQVRFSGRLTRFRLGLATLASSRGRLSPGFAKKFAWIDD